MKRIISAVLPLLVTGSLILLGSCDQKEDYSHIVFRNYLTYEISSATGVLNSSSEGTGEGEYHSGSKQAYQQVIEMARAVAEDQASDQEEIDGAYAELLGAAETFFDEMVPFRSAFQIWIDYSEVLLETTEEGQEEAVDGGVAM